MVVVVVVVLRRRCDSRGPSSPSLASLDACRGEGRASRRRRRRHHPWCYCCCCRRRVWIYMMSFLLFVCTRFLLSIRRFFFP